MRKILFRGKRTKDGVWVQGDLSTEYISGKVYIVQSAVDDDCIHIDLKTGGLVENDQITVWHEVDPETVAQMVGVVDIEDESVFEYHIVGYEDGEYSFVAVVEWGNTGFYLRGLNPRDNFNFDDFINIDNKSDVKIIGNIFDNPEFLGGRVDEE